MCVSGIAESVRQLFVNHPLLLGIGLEHIVLSQDRCSLVVLRGILTPDSGMYRFAPDVVIVSVLGETLCPSLYEAAPSLARIALDGVLDWQVLERREHLRPNWAGMV